MLRFLLCVTTLTAVTARSHSDLEHVFSPSHSLFDEDDVSTLRAAVKHEKKVIHKKNQDDELASMHVACSSYSSVRALESSLHNQIEMDDVHPVYFSRLNDKACYTFHATPSTTTALAMDGVKTSVVPHALKIDTTVAWTSGMYTTKHNVIVKYTF